MRLGVCDLVPDDSLAAERRGKVMDKALNKGFVYRERLDLPGFFLNRNRTLIFKWVSTRGSIPLDPLLRGFFSTLLYSTLLYSRTYQW